MQTAQISDSSEARAGHILDDDAPHLLVVDDDNRIRSLLSRYLTEKGYRVTLAENAASARNYLQNFHFDLMILDVMMPGESGVELTESLRKNNDIAILMLTARAETEHRISGLSAGVDDYLAKPFDPTELLLRVKSILRRSSIPTVPLVEFVCFGPYTFHLARGELKRGEAIIRLTDREKEMLRSFAERAGEMMGVSAQRNTINVAIAAWAWPSYFDPEERLKGIRLDIAHYRRPDPRTAPCNSKAAGLYMICTLSKHAAEQKGYADALMLDWRGQVAEATGANIFFVKDGVIHTPIPDCFLDGITRRTAIDLAKRRGLEVIERVILPEEMTDFEQCFLTGTAAEVTPVSEIGPYRFSVGEIVRTLMKDYDNLVNGKPVQNLAAE